MCLTCTLVHRSWTGLEWQTRLLEASLAFDIWMILSRLIFWLRSNIKCIRVDLALIREPNDRMDSKQRTWLAEMTSFCETQWQGGNSENASKGWKVHSFVCYQPGGGLLCSHFDASRESGVSGNSHFPWFPGIQASNFPSLPVKFCNFPSRSREKEVLAWN